MVRNGPERTRDTESPHSEAYRGKDITIGWVPGTFGRPTWRSILPAKKGLGQKPLLVGVIYFAVTHRIYDEPALDHCDFMAKMNDI